MTDYRAILKKRRYALHMTQEQLALAVGKTKAYIYEIESGRKTPSLDLFFAICEALDIRVFPDE